VERGLILDKDTTIINQKDLEISKKLIIKKKKNKKNKFSIKSQIKAPIKKITKKKSILMKNMNNF
jgi:hypothetical protein